MGLFYLMHRKIQVLDARLPSMSIFPSSFLASVLECFSWHFKICVNGKLGNSLLIWFMTKNIKLFMFQDGRAVNWALAILWLLSLFYRTTMEEGCLSKLHSTDHDKCSLKGKIKRSGVCFKHIHVYRIPPGSAQDYRFQVPMYPLSLLLRLLKRKEYIHSGKMIVTMTSMFE